jgi:hypothetical protein
MRKENRARITNTAARLSADFEVPQGICAMVCLIEILSALQSNDVLDKDTFDGIRIEMLMTLAQVAGVNEAKMMRVMLEAHMVLLERPENERSQSLRRVLDLLDTAMTKHDQAKEQGNGN